MNDISHSTESVPQVGVSNTEVQQANTCELAWLNGFHPEMNYQLRDFGPARTRGIIGHKALEIFYLGIKETEDYDKSAQEALNYLQGLRKEEINAGDFADPDRLKMLNYLHNVLDRYFEWYQDDIDNWEILEVEAFHAQEQPGEVDFYLPSRLDMVIYQKSGKFAGETSPVDHKFVYDFWNQWDVRLNSQLPLYIMALRAAHYAGKLKPVVRRAIVNQVRTRELSTPSPYDLFKREFAEYTQEKIDEVFKNHMKSAVHLAYLKRLPLEEALEEVRASFGSKSCRYCDFKEMCDAQFEKRDTSNVVMALYKKSTYGYPPLEDIRRERD